MPFFSWRYQVKITLVQSTVFLHKSENIKHIEKLLKNVNDTDVICLPEMFLSSFDPECFALNYVQDGDETYLWMSHLAREKKVYLIAGSVPEKVGNSTMYNTTYVFGPDGSFLQKYRKIHLFSITFPNGKLVDEGSIIKAGSAPSLFTTPLGKFALAICFDVRFPLLFHHYQRQGASIVFVPAAFNSYTGPRDWETLFRARAMDNQVFVIGVSPSTSSEGKYNYYGHSIVVAPNGDVLYQADKLEVVHTISIDLDLINKVRDSFPVVTKQHQI